ncbi:hypothetical protein Gotur_032814 [Gossypium turneri]
MTPPIETTVKPSDSHCTPHPPLNERILSSMTRRLHLAAWARQAQVVSYLCKQRADVGAAAMDGMGVSVRTTNRKGFTPLHYAVQGSHLEVIKVLLKKGASG